MESNVRKRNRPMKGPSTSESLNIQQPLLDGEDRDVASPSTSPRSRSAANDQSRALVPRSINKVDWEDFLRVVYARCSTALQDLIESISHCISPLLPPHLRPLQVSLLQKERLEQLQARIPVPYDGNDPEHQELLRKLWAASFNGEPCGALKTPRWKDMGWQGDDPGTDFRGGGLLSLHNHLWMAANRAALFDQLRYKRQGKRSEWEYPFAVAGVNLTFMLGDLLDLREPGRVPRSAAGKGFVGLLAASGAAFEEVYCLAFQLFDVIWLQMGANYMEFPAVMKRVQEQLGPALSQRPATLEQLRRNLGLQPI